jgi:exodeoxyribonuclease V beta subunit
VSRRHEKPPILGRLSHEAHAVIEASAGTGKTYTLEHLLVDLLLSTDTELESILVVTYTERAAAELRTRLRSKLRAMLETGEDPPAEAALAWTIDDGARRKLARALVSFDLASISTIHGFCQRMLIEHAFLAERLFEQSLVDGRSAFSRGFMAALRTTIAKDEVERAYLETWLRKSRLEQLEDILYECHERRGAIRPRFSQDAVLEAARALKSVALASDKLKRLFFAAKVNAQTQNAFLTRYGALLAILETLDSARDLPRFLAAIAEEESARSNGFLKYLVEASPKVSLADRSVQGLLAAVRDLQKVLPSLTAAVVQRFLPIIEGSIRSEKSATGEIDFDDMLDLLWESLQGEKGGHVAESMRARYRYALVDEFQDTDRTQWKIIERVFLQDDPKKSTLYVIGDPKQAIYGFRGADVATYLFARREIERRGGRTVSLAENHRSDGALVEALNVILDQSAPCAFFTGDIRYDVPVRAAWARTTRHPPIEILRVSARPGPGNIADATSELKLPAVKRALGRKIAQRIRALLDDREGPPTAPSDIFILTRTLGESVEIARDLRSAAIPYAFYKQEGLFQTEEAKNIRRVLLAIADPSRRALRFQAYLTPFFAVPIEALPACADLPPNHPLIARLFDWKALADAKQHHRLFSAILDESGIIRREIFTQESERELTNYLHIFEILLEEAQNTRATLDELIRLLSAFIEGRRLPEGENGNVQRLESERSAVQIMTMHKSKGLEAKIVFLFGGFEQFPGSVHVYHEDGERVLALNARNTQAERERDEEDQRLLYVALTRAKERLVLPYFGPLFSSDRRVFNGRGVAAKHLSEVLDRVVDRAAVPPLDRLFAIEEVHVGRDADPPDAAAYREALATWNPPRALIEGAPVESRFQALAHSRRGFSITSYSGIKAARGGYHPPAAADERRDELEPEVDGASTPKDTFDLPGGPASGRFIHEVLEQIPFETIASAPTFEFWCARKDVRAVFDEALKRHDRDPRCLAASQRLVHAALTHPLPLGQGTLDGGVARAKTAVREMEFLYPTPHRRGYIKGFIDLVFEHDGKVFILDWKSDLLPAYRLDDLTVHVANNYALQGELYSLAIVKMFGIGSRQEHDRRFGGVLFCFVRGMGEGEPDSGVMFTRPAWKDVVASEERLVG